ncbi:MAG: PucR family transcriptional regulator [Humibacillus sp.]|nr:PucR family transcriptional regulator [Humibacillus sp.]
MSREAVRASLVDDLPATAASIVSTIREQIPAYAALSEAQLAQVSAIASWALDRVLDLWVSDGQLSPTDIGRFERLGTMRALDGRPLPGVLRAYRLAGTTILDLVTRTVRDELTVVDAMALANVWMATIDTLSEALHAGHGQATDRLAEDRATALSDLLGLLLIGRQVTLTALADRSRQLGIRLPDQPVVVLLQTGDPARPITVDALDDVLATSGLIADESVLRSVTGTRGVVLCDGASVHAIRAAGDALRLRGCAVQATGANDVHRAHHLAALCLDRAPAHAHERRPVLDEGDAQVIALLAADPLADPVRAAGRVLGDVLGDGNQHVLEALDAFLSTGSATAAADRLGVHPQTMRYRLRRLRDLTGRDPRQPWDGFVLGAARQAAPEWLSQ